ncbi:helix-turn-helix transcriptional regulator [Robiginitalea sp. IMCC43444]|uniref:helix-turn-helix transcriptional regulator n=1 Tax=Robiginitalea sp. IMCC43444 TaxID=3459121 RepID=UPI0040436472
MILFHLNNPHFITITFPDSKFLLYGFGLVLGLFIIYLAYRAFNRFGQKKTSEIINREQELQMVRREKEKLEASNAKLRKDVVKKSQKLAATTLMVVRKNELLMQIKNELRSLKESSKNVESIIRGIDRNLNQNDDWELFKDAFNQTDRKFLKKLEKRHPNLSPNDIRLCAYLRLNLSSKEMAPLFNISVRSVEIKRYRLRKKMNLSHDENLVNYILKL